MTAPAEEIVVGRCACKDHHLLSDPTAGGKLCGADTHGKDPPPKYPTCHRPAGWGTPDGVGPNRRCKLHGGCSLVRTGRYTRIKRPRVAELIQEMVDDPDPLNILPELAAARGLFIDFIERYDVWREALLAWHADWQLKRRPLPEDLLTALGHVVDEYEIALREASEPTDQQVNELAAARRFVDFMRGVDGAVRPREVLDVSAAMSHVDTITKIAEREWKRHEANAISRKDLFRVLEQYGRGVMKHVTDRDILRAIRAEWLNVAL